MNSGTNYFRKVMCASQSVYLPLKQRSRPAAYVYCGPGAGFRSALSAMKSLRLALGDKMQVDRLTPDQLLASGWQEGCVLLVMPGGADLPYCKLLNGTGNQLIREYVEGGGSYLGLCAGAYYGCARVEFEPGTKLEVVGERELSFFPGVARGSIYRGFEYESENGADAARLQFLDLAGSDPLGRIPLESSAPAHGQPNASPDGGSWRECHDYINGGPGFFPFSPEDPPLSLPHPPPASVSVLATYPDRGGAAAALLCAVGAGRAVLCGTHPELDPSWLEPCLEEGEGGYAVCSDITRSWRVKGKGVSSWVEEAGESSAAGACTPPAAAPAVAAAVTSGTGGPGEQAAVRVHPSHGASVSPAARQMPSVSLPESEDSLHPRAPTPQQRLRGVHAQLVASQRERWRLWRGLLVAAGLGDYLREQPATN